jgi:energy-coupling factor transport system permease protein
MLASVLCRFSVFNKIFTSDKLICLFGRILPSLSLIISMTLRFVPRFKVQLKAVTDAQKCVGRDITSGSLKRRIKNGLDILSSMTSWSLENAIETADSMKARGYGLSGRTAFSIYRFDKRDLAVLMSTVIPACYVIAGAILGEIDFKYFPSFKINDVSFYGVSVYVSYGLLCALPIIFELWEVTKWKSSK